MKRFVNLTMVSTILIFSMLFSREVGEINVEVNPTIKNNGKEYSITQSENQTNPSSRELFSGKRTLKMKQKAGQLVQDGN